MKKLVVIFLLIAMTLGISGCESEDDRTEVLIWHTYGGDIKGFIDEEVRNFNASNEDIAITVETYPEEDFEKTVEEAIANGKGPDIIIHYASEASKYIDQGLVVDLESYINDEANGIADFKDNIDKQAYEESRSFKDGKMHFLPLACAGPVFYYNKTIYEELGLSVPTTWEELSANCEKIKEAYPDKAAFGTDNLNALALAFIGQSSEALFDLENNTATFNTDEVKTRLDSFKTWTDEGLFRLSSLSGSFSEDFNSGNLVSYMDSIAAVKNITIENYEVAPLMQNGDSTFTPLKDLGVIIFASDKVGEQAAFEVAKYLVSPDVNTKLCKTLGFISPYKLVRDNKEYQDYVAQNKAIEAFPIDEAEPLPAIEGLNGVITAITDLLSDVASGEDVNMALMDAETKANESLNPSQESSSAE